MGVPKKRGAARSDRSSWFFGNTHTSALILRTCTLAFANPALVAHRWLVSVHVGIAKVYQKSATLHLKN